MRIAIPAPVNMDTVKAVVDDLRLVEPGVYFVHLSFCAVAG